MLFIKEIENAEYTLSQTSLLLEQEHMAQSTQWGLRESLLGTLGKVLSLIKK